jgi:hypothetical protein
MGENPQQMAQHRANLPALSAFHADDHLNRRLRIIQEDFLERARIMNALRYIRLHKTDVVHPRIGRGMCGASLERCGIVLTLVPHAASAPSRLPVSGTESATSGQDRGLRYRRGSEWGRAGRRTAVAPSVGAPGWAVESVGETGRLSQG